MALQLKDKIVQTEHGIQVLENELERLQVQQEKEKYINPYFAYKYAYEAIINGGNFIPDIDSPLPIENPMYVSKDYYYTDGENKYICIKSGAIAEVDEDYLQGVN